MRNDWVYYPGGDWTYWGTAADAHFAGFELGEGPNYNTPAREYSGGQGRWLTPDPLGGDITNPQSLNRFAYALNNPTTLADPSGLGPDWNFEGVDCRSSQYADSHAECQQPGSPWCFEQTLYGGPCSSLPSPFPGGGGGDGSSPATSTTGTSSAPTGEAFRSSLPCIPSHNLAALIPSIVAGLTAIFGNSPSAQAILNANPTLRGPNPTLPVEGGAAVFNIPDITPSQSFEINLPKLPGFHPGQASQVYFPVPSKPVGGGYGAGDVLHVVFNTSVNGAGKVTGITSVTGHFDIHNPFAAGGLGVFGHIGADLILAQIASEQQGGCAVKFQ